MAGITGGTDPERAGGTYLRNIQFVLEQTKGTDLIITLEAINSRDSGILSNELSPSPAINSGIRRGSNEATNFPEENLNCSLGYPDGPNHVASRVYGRFPKVERLVPTVRQT